MNNNVYVYIEAGIRNRWYLFKGLMLKLYLMMHGCSAGKSLKCKQWPVFRQIPWKNIRLGDWVTLGHNITFDISLSGWLIIDNNVNLSQDILISSLSTVRIGADTLIGEQTSIRDADHGTSSNQSLSRQPLTFEKISIGRDVWIGAGCRILKGSIIPEGAVIGANAVVLKTSLLEPYSIYAGAPVRRIGKRP